MKKSLLVFDENLKFAKEISDTAEKLDHASDFCRFLEQAKELVKTNEYRVILLDTHIDALTKPAYYGGHKHDWYHTGGVKAVKTLRKKVSCPIVGMSEFHDIENKPILNWNMSAFNEVIRRGDNAEAVVAYLMEKYLRK